MLRRLACLVLGHRYVLVLDGTWGYASRCRRCYSLVFYSHEE